MFIILQGTREYQKNLALKCISNQQGDILERLVQRLQQQTEYHFKLVLLSLVYFTSVAFYFVVASIQESVSGILFINHVVVPVQHCHNNEINTIPLPVINSVWLYCDNPRHSVYFFIS